MIITALCQMLIAVCVVLCLAALGIVTWIAIWRAVYGIETLTPDKIKNIYSYDQGVPEQISNVMWRKGNPLPSSLRQPEATPQGGEGNA